MTAADDKESDPSDHEAAVEHPPEGNALLQQVRPARSDPIGTERHPRTDDAGQCQRKQEKNQQAMMNFKLFQE